jgi:flagellar hook-associated protein 3 FlgL
MSLTGFSGLGDAARQQLLQRDGTRLREALQRLTTELGTGRHADLGRATGGDFTPLADLGRSLRLSETFARTIAEAGMLAGARQAALGRIEAELEGVAPHLLGLAAGGSLQDVTLAIADAGERLDLAVTTLNTRLAGQSLFAGNAPDRTALIPAGELLDHLRPLAAAAATPGDMVAAVEDWFLAPGGGYDTLAWQGGAGAAAPAILGEGIAVETGITARDPALREVLAGLALAALTAEGVGPDTGDDRRALVSAAALRLENGEDALIRLRSDLGQSEARIEEARSAAEATRATLELETARLTGADPYRTATELEAVETRLEALYLLTARLSRLSLSEYL